MERFWEIDFFRGSAVILMIIFNYAFALRYFGIYDVGLGFLFWWLFPRLIAGAFIFIAGLSLAVSYSRLKGKRIIYRKFISRGLKIFSLGLLITLVTFFLVPSVFVMFGILHFIGAAVMLSPIFLKLDRKYILIAALSSLVAGIYLQGFSVSFPWLLWLGFIPENLITLDYFPLLPWLGIFLLGIYSSGILYKNGRRIFRISKQPAGSRLVCLLGRNSLLIYMLHQPLLTTVLLLLNYRIF